MNTHEFRDRITTTQKNKPESRGILADIKIAQDRELMHFLGAFIGNYVDNVSMWIPTVDKIERDLKRWNRGNS